MGVGWGGGGGVISITTTDRGRVVCKVLIRYLRYLKLMSTA